MVTTTTIEIDLDALMRATNLTAAEVSRIFNLCPTGQESLPDLLAELQAHEKWTEKHATCFFKIAAHFATCSK
jgi:hypothetical protein